ncbi:Crp/Fnr family transcriptional regulator [Hymenobacter weizhouensis]|uniref:Crp/Fnr family transcriptional regulator n=1 Tax=Hymenobacter sp. YIM 151500-1 TaxID=2987689 RepID=UPI0022272E28|nr:Crp/Fnr family transcriptional regulator [Hymenobacter sp. YIM 151500-1]UYZ63093.1 Crp/Fnr family transcriptional regulator [Hymenobacter sp. YIM 151500-1]
MHLLSDESLRANIAARVRLSEADFACFRQFVKPLAVPKRQFFLLEGDECTRFGFVVRGCLRSYSIDDKGEEHTMQFAPEDWWISDPYSFLTGRPSTLTIDALEDTELWVITASDMEKVYAAAPVFERFMRLLIQSRYIALQERVNAALRESAAQKYDNFLRKYPTLVQRVPQHLIASYLGIKPESLSRVRRLSRRG